ncbi:hypothetical protein SIL73_15890 [Acidithiobacillus thiooxidans]|uniref:hypothetical protein n=1 Tax=Acidithiobacillus thiooxidans TaxID=930 RepID=UPI001478C298|nr:hypothetical protein [Acidithiobacillus thiooxidans]MDX5936152.1 hypothetical protein [Acidithiobacillus thiooxidans]
MLVDASAEKEKTNVINIRILMITVYMELFLKCEPCRIEKEDFRSVTITPIYGSKIIFKKHQDE